MERSIVKLTAESKFGSLSEVVLVILLPKRFHIQGVLNIWNNINIFFSFKFAKKRQTQVN